MVIDVHLADSCVDFICDEVGLVALGDLVFLVFHHDEVLFLGQHVDA